MAPSLVVNRKSYEGTTSMIKQLCTLMSSTGRPGGIDAVITSAQVLSRSEAAAQLRSWRKKWYRVLLTHGNFNTAYHCSGTGLTIITYSPFTHQE